jgi:hypothetical protein
MKTRDEFSEPVKRILALRAAHRCSNPLCRRLTIKPTDTGGAVSSGIAAHVSGAARGGPRFNANQTPEERAGAANGIWLCHNCSDVIDKDEGKYPPELLFEWRRQHEAWVSNEDLVPKLPSVKVSTLKGFSLPEHPGTVQFRDFEGLREHSIVLSATSRHELQHVKMRLQFPELIAFYEVAQAPAGVAVKIGPEKVNWMVHGSGGGSVTLAGPARPSPNFVIELERLVPRRDLVLRVRTAVDRSPAGARNRPTPRGDALVTYVMGEFLYVDGSQMFERRFLVPLDVDDERNVTAQETEEDYGTRALIQVTRWG